MRKPSDPADNGHELWEKLIGLGDESHRKSYYPELQRRLEELERFKAFLDYSHDAIFLVEVPSGRIVDFNDAACRQTGWEHEELLELSIFNVFELAGNEEAKDLICACGEVQRKRARLETNLFRRSAPPIPAELTLACMFFREAGYVIVVARDIAKRKAAEDALEERVRLAELGAEVGAALTKGKDLRDSLQRCAESLIGHTGASFCRIWVIDKEDPEILELKASAGLYTRIDGRHSRKKVGDLKVGKIAREGKPYLTNSILGDPEFSDQTWARREGMVAFAGYPLVVNDRTVGVIALFSKRPMTDAVLAALASVADEIAVGVERQRAEEALWESEIRRLRLQTQLEFAAQVQEKLLPKELPHLAGFEIAARCLPAYQVGGDFYDWQETAPGLVSITLGDVMGKGMAAAMLMATVRASLRAVSQAYAPAEALEQASSALSQDLGNSESFVTLFHARLDVATRRMTYVDCGHGLVFMLRANGSVEELLPRGLPLGVLPDENFLEGCTVFEKGDSLVLFSDGLIDAMQQFELNDASLVRRFWALSAEQLVAHFMQIMPPQAMPLEDDMTLVVVKCTGGN
jgi:PAS domain S-box-containing protein